MTSPVKNIARSASQKESLNILSFICDGYFDTMLCDALPQHNFYGPINDGSRPVGWNFTLCPQPSNFHYVPNFNQSNITSTIDFDLIICHDRTSQYDMAKQLANMLHINIIIAEHIANTDPIDLISMIPLLKKTKNDTNIFVANVADQLKISGQIIRYGIPNLYHEDKKDQIAILNIEQKIIDDIQPHLNTPIILRDINTLTSQQYFSLLQESKFYFNLEAETTKLQLPVLHAMSAGCVVVSMSSPAINDLITHGENGIIIGGMEELLTLFKWKDIDKLETEKISKAANQYIVENYSSEQFSQKWQAALMETANKTYVR